MCSTRQRLSALIREQRMAKELTLRNAAEKAGLAPSTLSRWESGACLPRIPELEALLRSLGVSEDDVTRILISLDAPRAAKAVRQGDPDGIPPMRAPSGGALLRALRSRAGMSVTFVAEALGVSPSSVSRWESSAAHPDRLIIERLLDLLGAGKETRACLSASGVAKLRVERRPYDRNQLSTEIDRIESGGCPQGEHLELRLLQLQSLLWWFREESGAVELLRRCFVVYAEYLCAQHRYREAIEQAQTVLESGLDPASELATRTWRAIARADVYRWPRPRPHLGLYTLQRCLRAGLSSCGMKGVLTDMAEYSCLADRPTDAIHYARRSDEVGTGLPALDLTTAVGACRLGSHERMPGDSSKYAPAC